MTAYEQEMEALRARVAELESAASTAKTSLISDNTSLRVLRERIEELEEKATSVDCVRVHRDIAEDERQDRWHATFNAALPEAMRVLRGLNDDHEMADRAAIICGIVADRAHGPLEVKKATTWTSDLEKHLQVAALVKAAREVVRRNRSGLPMSDEIYDLETAAKPFEVQP